MNGTASEHVDLLKRKHRHLASGDQYLVGMCRNGQVMSQESDQVQQATESQRHGASDSLCDSVSLWLV